jgi:hypothetical protein
MQTGAYSTTADFLFAPIPPRNRTNGFGSGHSLPTTANREQASSIIDQKQELVGLCEKAAKQRKHAFGARLPIQFLWSGLETLRNFIERSIRQRRVNSSVPRPDPSFADDRRQVM